MSTEPTPDQLGPSDVAKAFVYGLIGVGATVVAEAPRAVKQARSDLTAARFIGEMAVTQGASQLRERLGRADESEAASPTSDPARGTSAGNSSVDSATAVDELVDRPDDIRDDGDDDVRDDGDVPSVAELAIPDYDTVPAIDVVMQLADLDADDRDRIEAYERANRGRRTILGKVDQLRGTG